MKALTLCQPYASMVALQIPGWEKTIETRRWPTKHRGPLLICAGANDWPAPDGYDGPALAKLPHGVALCVVDVVDCRPMRPEDVQPARVDFADHLFAWELENVRRITPFPVKGRQQIFNVELGTKTCGELAMGPTAFQRSNENRGLVVHA